MVTVCQICLAAERTRGSQIPPGEEVVIAVVFVPLETVTLFASLLAVFGNDSLLDFLDSLGILLNLLTSLGFRR